jgi:type II secretory ATPase GspE/PulE/Tfp pilus assembly ATPase PilB-like protein
MSETERDYFFQKPLEPSKDYEEFIQRALLPEISESNGEKNGKTCEKCEGTGFFERKPIVEIYTHDVQNDDILHAICDGDPSGRKRLKQLFQNGTYEPFALGALDMVLYGVTSPGEIMRVLPTSYFRDYSELLIKRANTVIADAIKAQASETKK